MNMCDMCSGKLRNEHPYLSTKNGKTKNPEILVLK